MARERGFVVEVTAFLPAGETDIFAMSVAAHKLQNLIDWMHEQGFSAVAVSSKFTSRKVEAADPKPDLDDSKFATNSGTPGLSLDRTDKQNADILNNGFSTQAVYNGLPPGNAPDPSYQGKEMHTNAPAMVEQDPLDLPPFLDKRMKAAGA